MARSPPWRKGSCLSRRRYSLRWRGLRGGGSKSGDGQTLGTGVVLGEPGCAQEKEVGETAFGLEGEKPQ